MRNRIKAWAAALKRDTLALYLAARDRRVPLGAKIIAGAVAAYAISPIDLIPDFIPVLGYLDDLIIVPVGIYVAVRLIPADVLEDLRQEAAERFASGKPVSRVAAAIVVLIWILVAVALLISLRELFDL
jgi:uncharacterized membrane protein YkvA (DUF1232 family)